MNPTVRTLNSNTPAIATATTALDANERRVGFSIQNLGTNVLFVRLGDGATTSLFHFALRAGTGTDDGTGGVLTLADSAVYTGKITVAGTSPRYTVLEMAP